jgi:hypothetical protein
MEKNNTAWFNEDILPIEMIKGATGEKGWGKLENSEHFNVLNSFIKDLNILKMADIGCGAAELGRVLSNINYTGFDLPHIINKVSKVVNPNLNYHYFNANNFDYTTLMEYNLLVCNGFISELSNPIEVLEKLINNTSEYLLIHRQYFSSETNFTEYATYGNLPTVRTHIGIDEFNKLLVNHEITNRTTNAWGDTILIKKK